MKSDIKSLPLYFLGSRNYVNGLSLFEEMLKAYEKRFGVSSPIDRIQNFKVNSSVTHNCRLLITEDKRNKFYGEKNSSSASIDLLRNDGKEIYLRLYEERENPVKKKIPDYDRGLYIKKEHLEKNKIQTVILHNIRDNCSLVRGIIEANFRYCVAQAQKMGITNGISWAYMKNLPWPASMVPKSTIKIRFKKKSLFYSTNIYIIRKLSIDSIDHNYGTEICFFFNNPSAARRPSL